MSDQPEQPPADIFAGVTEEPEEGAAQFHAEVDLADVGIDPFDHASEERAIGEDRAKNSIPAPERPTRLTAPVNTPALLEDPVADLKTDVDASFSGVFNVGPVTVEPDERERFMRCALHDEEMWFDITLEGMDTTVRVAIPPESFTAAVATAISAWDKAGVVDSSSNMQFYLAMQQLHAWFQVREVGGKHTPWSDAFADGMPKASWIRQFTRDPDNFDAFFNMSAARWRLLVESMRVAEFKYKLCLEAWRDRSFFTQAGTA